MTSAIPRGTIRKRFSRIMGACLPCDFVHRADAGVRDFGIGVGDCFQPAILSMRAAGLKGHHESLTGGVGDGIGHFETVPVQPMENFKADTDTLIDQRLVLARAGRFRCFR